MKLVSYTAMRKSIGFDAGVQQEAIEDAIESATEQVASDIRVPSFDRQTLVDKFAITSMACLQYGSGSFRTRLALTMGFVSSVVRVDWANGSSGFLSDSGVLVEGQYEINLEKGNVLIRDVNLRDATVDIEYVAGFEPDATDPTLYKQDQVPEWLKRIAMLQATILLDTANPTLRHEKDAGPAIKELRASYDRLSTAKMRYFPSETHPII